MTNRFIYLFYYIVELIVVAMLLGISHQHAYGPRPRYQGVSRYPSIWCTNEAPCYQYVLNIVMDGVEELETSPDAIQKHCAMADIGREGILARGQDALAFFKVGLHNYGLCIHAWRMVY